MNIRSKSNILLIFLIIILIIIFFIFGLKSSLITLGIFSFLMFLNINFTNIINIVLSKDKNVDILYWRLILVLISSISLGIGICI